MGFSNASIFVSTFLIIMFLVVVVKKTRNTDQEVTIYNFSFDEGEDEEIDDTSSLLHISQIVKKAPDDGEPALVQVDFPMNGQDYIVMSVKVVNYNPKKSKNPEDENGDVNFWAMISYGAIGTNTVKLEIVSYNNIDVDVEFYGYRDMAY